MEKVHSWCGQPSDRGRLRNRTEHVHVAIRVHVARYSSLLTPPRKVFSTILCLLCRTSDRSNYRLMAVGCIHEVGMFMWSS